MKIFIFHHGLLTARLAKTTTHRVLFLVSMDSQRSKKLDGSQFWALECLLTASEWLEFIPAIMAPTRVITSFQSSCEIGLRVKIHLYDQTEVVEFFPYVLSFLIPHHVGQITQTFGHTICQMSS